MNRRQLLLAIPALAAIQVVGTPEIEAQEDTYNNWDIRKHGAALDTQFAEGFNVYSGVGLNSDWETLLGQPMRLITNSLLVYSNPYKINQPSRYSKGWIVQDQETGQLYGNLIKLDGIPDENDLYWHWISSRLGCNFWQRDFMDGVNIRDMGDNAENIRFYYNTIRDVRRKIIAMAEAGELGKDYQGQLGELGTAWSYHVRPLENKVRLIRADGIEAFQRATMEVDFQAMKLFVNDPYGPMYGYYTKKEDFTFIFRTDQEMSWEELEAEAKNGFKETTTTS